MCITMRTFLLHFAFIAINANYLKPRIMGGQLAKPSEFPYQGFLLIDGFYRCGATLIDRNLLLSTASCIRDIVDTRPIVSTVKVKLGSIYLIHGIIYSVRRISHHVAYSTTYPLVYVHDIAVIHLTQNVTYSRHISPINLPEKMDVVEYYTHVIVTGFGSRNFNDNKTAEQLKKLILKTSTLEACRPWYPFITLQKTQLCTIPGEGFGCTLADRGSPMVNLAKMTLLGVVSIPSIHYGGPDIYTQVSSYIDYINDERTYFTQNYYTRRVEHPAVNFPMVAEQFFK